MVRKLNRNPPQGAGDGVGGVRRRRGGGHGARVRHANIEITCNNPAQGTKTVSAVYRDDAKVARENLLSFR